MSDDSHDDEPDDNQTQYGGTEDAEPTTTVDDSEEQTDEEYSVPTGRSTRTRPTDGIPFIPGRPIGTRDDARFGGA
ncbi:hypothetical protein [Natrarchaeobius oligotrophus]|uniref:hypothetical protein n=1 Tax=Natrarchaeobius oligotrophus TaxID=3455743 RepID=UPI0014048BE1|nr:hypothetical protein [Natrarchaeobius chitinivorans]